MKYFILILSLLIGSAFAQNQELRFGLAGGFNAYQFTNWDAAIHQPENSYFTYSEEFAGDGLIFQSHALNGFSVGGLGSFAVRKWTLNIEPQYTLYRSTYVFTKEYYTERVVGTHSLRIPLFFTWRFFRKANSLYITAGFIANYVKNKDFQSPGFTYLFSGGQLYDGGIDYGDDHFEGVLYNRGRYWDRFIGLGKTVNNLNVAVRLVTRTNRSKEKILADMLRVELNLSFYLLTSSDLTAKRKIYYE